MKRRTAQRPPILLTRLPQLDEILEAHATQLGGDFRGYRNHAYRVANFCCALAGVDRNTDGDSVLHTISIAAAFHDLGIWTDETFDYLGPSQRLAREWAVAHDRPDSAFLVDGMVRQHHKVTPYIGDDHELINAFRRADWADVSRGIVAPGVPRHFLRDVLTEFPNAGFHRCLFRLSCRRLLSHPLNPLPMVRW
jgi:hypothetical protein